MLQLNILRIDWEETKIAIAKKRIKKFGGILCYH